MGHEQGAAHAADAYGIVSGDPGVCMATSGPGATNLVTGIADADMDSDPLLALTGQVPTDFVGNDAFQETDTMGVTLPVTKANYFANDSAKVGDTVGEAFAVARDGRQGPTLVDLPKDITQGETDKQPGGPERPENFVVPDAADEEVVVAAADALDLVDKDPALTPLVQFASLLIADNAFEALEDNREVPEVKDGTAYRMLEVTRKIADLDKGNPAPSTIAKLLWGAIVFVFISKPLYNVVRGIIEARTNLLG
jgi:acetolactate synthase-1/2/3 large subunit